MDDKAYWIAFNMVPGIGAARLSALLDLCGSIESAWKTSIQNLKAAGLDRRTQENLLHARREIDVEDEWRRIQRAGIRVVTWDDADYPQNLRHIDAPPPTLYVRGEFIEPDTWAVAVVGTRRASSYGREVAYSLGSELARSGLTVISGLALGIDTVAHKSALEAGGRTLAVLGSGVDQIYPPGNRGLAREIVKNGAIISEYALGVRPEASNFPPRNRIISGLSKGVIVVEAPRRSGALITARFAADQGRDVFAVPGNILNAGSVGCNTLIQKGATPLLSLQDVLEQLELDRVAIQREARQLVPPDELESQLLAHISVEPCHVDEIVRLSAMPPPQVASLLTIMELKGLVRQVGAMNYVRC